MSGLINKSQKKIKTQKLKLHGNTFLIQSSNQSFLESVKKKWPQFYIDGDALDNSKPKAIFNIVKDGFENFKCNSLVFDNGKCLFVTGLRHRVVGYFYQHPWQIFIQAPNQKNIFKTLEPLLQSVLGRLNLFPLHGIVEVKNGKGSKQRSKSSIFNKCVKVSVCMPAYNASQYVKEAIESVLAQNYGPFELLICNDGSTDNTFKLINQYQHHPNVRIYANRRNLGPAATRNKLVRLAKGEYITPCDADDLMLQNNLAGMSRFLDTHQNIGAVYANWLVLNTSCDDKIISAPQMFGKDHGKIWDLRENAFNHGGSMIRKKLILEAGGYDETVFSTDDWSLWIKLNEITQVHYLKNEIYYIWRKHPKSITRNDRRDNKDLQKIIGQALARRNLMASRCARS